MTTLFLIRSHINKLAKLLGDKHIIAQSSGKTSATYHIAMNNGVYLKLDYQIYDDKDIDTVESMDEISLRCVIVIDHYGYTFLVENMSYLEDCVKIINTLKEYFTQRLYQEIYKHTEKCSVLETELNRLNDAFLTLKE